MNKNEKIKRKIKETRSRRKSQVCKVFELKLQNLSTRDIALLERLFLEAKWFYNYIIADIQNRLTNGAWKLKEVEVKTPNGIERRTIECLSSQVRQGIVERAVGNLRSLKKAKEKGHKVGKLKFKSEVKSIPLKQYGITYTLFRDKNRVKIQGIRKRFRVLGLRQIPEESEIANAWLVKKPSGFYLHVVCYLPKETDVPKFRMDKPVGLDFGIRTRLTLSSGLAIHWEVPETKRLLTLQRKLSRQKKGSRNYLKTKKKIRKEWEYITNVRRDIRNRIFSFLRCYDRVVMQKENVKGWHRGLFSRQVQITGLGGITSSLEHRLETLSLVDRYLPTSKTCCRCGRLLDLSLSDRVVDCDCGLTIDRDLNAAINVLRFGLREEALAGRLKPVLPVDCGEVTPVERMASARILGPNPYIRVSHLVETGSPFL